MTRLVVAFLLLAPWGVTGCVSPEPSGSLRAESLGRDPVILDGQYQIAFYAVHDSTETSFFLANMPLEELLSGRITQGIVVHIDLLWNPKAGATPMDSSATNASVRYIVIADGELGVYGGAGFASVRGRTGAEALTLLLRDASLTLLESTDGFVDLLSPARLTGELTASLDERRAQQIRFAISQLVTDALGYTRLVTPIPLRSSSWSSASASDRPLAP